MLAKTPKDGGTFTKVSIVMIGKDVVEKSQSEADNVEEELPRFVSTGNFFCWVARWSVKRAGQIWCCISYSFTVRLPHLPDKNGKIPRILGIRFLTLDCPTEKRKDKVAQDA